MAEWINTTLGEFVGLQRGHDLPAGQRISGSVPVVGSGGIAGWHNESKVSGPGITIGRAANLGVPTLTERDFWPLNTTLYVTDFRGNNVRFTYHLFQVLDLAGFNSGSVQPMLNRNYIKAFPIRVPDRSGQDAIAALLGALDDKVAVNARIAATADALSHSLYSQQFGTPAGPDRSGWTPGLLSDICSTQYGYTATSTATPVGPRFLRVKDINKNNWITWPDVPYCEIDDRSLDRYRLSVGDLLVARMADPGKSAIVEESMDAVFASYLVRLKTASLAHSYFIWGFLKSDAYGKYAESVRSGSVQANMNAKVIVGAELLIPPTELMKKYLGTVMPLRRRLTASLRESEALTVLRDTLLPQLMSGRLRVKDAEKIVEDNT
ncbi:restriction endonuclease subunit S [Streptomyces sp. NPDC002911]